jgi:hypothetical protein
LRSCAGSGWDARRAQALALAATLDGYNNGSLC